MSSEKELKSKRVVFNLIWLVSWLVLSFVYNYFPPLASVAKSWPEWLKVIVGLGPVLIVQIALHAFLLNRKFPSLKKSNLYWVIAMPLVFLILIFVVIDLYIWSSYSHGPFPD